jgi:anti-sigma factor RsiW
MNDARENVRPFETIDERDLHAYVDGLLDEQRANQFQAYLRRHPEAKAKVHDYLEQNRLLGEIFKKQNQGAVPLRLLSALNQPVNSAWPRVGKVAAVLALCVASAGGGWWGASHNQVAWSEQDSDLAAFIDQVALTSQPPSDALASQPVVSTLEAPVNPLGWPADTVAGSLQAPNLAPQGYTFEQQRLLMNDSQAFLEFAYTDASAKTLKFYVKTRWPDEAALVRVVQTQDQSIAYWQEGPFTYAMSGAFEREYLAQLAQWVRAAMTPMAPEPVMAEPFAIHAPDVLQSAHQPLPVRALP